MRITWIWALLKYSPVYSQNLRTLDKLSRKIENVFEDLELQPTLLKKVINSNQISWKIVSTMKSANLNIYIKFFNH